MTSRQPDHESNTLSGIMDGPSAPTPLAMPSDKPSGPTLGTRLIIFSALALPSALIPLLVLRRNVNNLHRKVDELKVATRNLHHDFKSVMLDLSVRREQHEQLQAMITGTRDGLTQLRGETYRKSRAHVREGERIQGQVQELEASNQYVDSVVRGSERFDAYCVTITLCNAGPRSCVYDSWGPLSLMWPHSCKRWNYSRDSSRPDLMGKALNVFDFLLCNSKGWVRLTPLMPM
jgi:hypothetical protein